MQTGIRIFDSITRQAYIEDRCIPEPNTGCWLWLRSIGSHGYGQCTDPVVPPVKSLKNPSRVTTAHRISYLAFKGEIPEGLHVDHTCRNRQCCNPDHLEAVTQGENNRRSSARDSHGSKELTSDKVRSIRALYKAGGITNEEIGRRFDVSGVQIANIVHRRQWAHVS